MRYEFYCQKCNKDVVLSFGMNDTDGRKNAKCPECGTALVRKFDAPAICMKGEYMKVAQNVPEPYSEDGIGFGFADYGKNSGLSKRSISNRIKGARVDEKSGRIVVDVVSSVPDPLGKIDRMRKTKIKKEINQKVRRR